MNACKPSVTTFAAMNQLPHDHITPFADPVRSKKEQVEEMFDGIAGRYDLMNRFLSGGIDMTWRRKAIRILKKDKPRHILDVATGTGDMAIMAAKMLEDVKITGLDLSAEMLELARKKIDKEQLTSKIEMLKGDAETINFPSDSFDAIMVAFGVRNFENLENGLREMLRVLVPGGRLVILEFSKPRNVGFRKMYNLYMGIVAPTVAKWFKQNKQAYQYLSESTKAFPDRSDLTTIMDQVGFVKTEYKQLSFGICCIYSGRKCSDR